MTKAFSGILALASISLLPSAALAADEREVAYFSSLNVLVVETEELVRMTYRRLPCCAKDKTEVMGRFETAKTTVGEARSRLERETEDGTNSGSFCSGVKRSRKTISATSVAMILANVGIEKALEDPSRYEREFQILKGAVAKLNSAKDTLNSVSQAKGC